MYTQLCSWENLLRAYGNASRGKRGQPSVAAFEYRLEDNLLALQRELLDGGYTPSGYVSFLIHEPKRRLISAAPFRDRVVHHALCQLIEPVFERSFIFDSYANRVGKGTHRALDRCQQFARRYAYVLQCDIEQFFPAIDHELLMAALAQKLNDARVLDLCELILRSGRAVHHDMYVPHYFPGDDLFAVNRARGLPIGNLTSQFWANVYLNAFDHFVKRELRCPAYVRYVDDILLFAEVPRLLWEWRMALIERLMRFRLTLHANAQPHSVTNGIPFLGFVVFPEHRRLKGRKVVHLRRRLDRALQLYCRGDILLSGVTSSVRGWVNHVRYGNTIGLRKAVLGGLIIHP
jgi:hypothetical protein